VAEVLTGEAAADEIDRFEVVRADLSDVLESRGVREVAREDRLTVGVLLDLPGDPHPGPLEAEVEAADSREEAADIHSPLRESRAPSSPSKRGA
jgi:hypothetical protein